MNKKAISAAAENTLAVVIATAALVIASALYGLLWAVTPWYVALAVTAFLVLLFVSGLTGPDDGS